MVGLRKPVAMVGGPDEREWNEREGMTTLVDQGRRAHTIPFTLYSLRDSFYSVAAKFHKSKIFDTSRPALGDRRPRIVYYKIILTIFCFENLKLQT